VTSLQDAKSHLSEPELVRGRRLLTTIAGGVTASVVIGATTWYALHWLVPSNGALTTQIVVAEVYSSLIVVYVLLRPIAGGLFDAARQILTLATDAKRLDGQPVSARVVAIARGCLIVPLFEELFFGLWS
jgi:hypothetical protein